MSGEGFPAGQYNIVKVTFNSAARLGVYLEKIIIGKIKNAYCLIKEYRRKLFL